MFPEEFSPLETMLGLWVHGWGWVNRGRILWVLYLLSRAQNPRRGAGGDSSVDTERYKHSSPQSPEKTEVK